MVGECKGICNLLAAVLASCDVMVSDYHGNRDTDTSWYKAIYLKIQITRQEAAATIFNQIQIFKSKEGRQDIYWGGRR